MAIGSIFSRRDRDAQTAEEARLADERAAAEERAVAEERAADRDRAIAEDAPTEDVRYDRADRYDTTDRYDSADRYDTTDRYDSADRYDSNPERYDNDRSDRYGTDRYSGSARTDVDDRLADRIDEADDRAAVTTPVTTAGVDTDRAVVRDRVVEDVDGRPVETVPVTTEEAVEPSFRAHTSLGATLSLILGLTSVYAALSGRLAPLAIAAGALGLLFGAVAQAAVARPRVTGHHVVLLGLLFSVAGVVFGILAANDALPWLQSSADQIGPFRDWLNRELPWVKDW